MLNELNALESKIAQVLALYRTLRRENDELREQLRATETDRDRLAERMMAACARLDELAQQLPTAKAQEV